MFKFNEFTVELPPFKDFLDCTFKEKQMVVVMNNSKVIHLLKLHQEIFSPSLQTNIESSLIMINIASIVATAIHAKLYFTKG